METVRRTFKNQVFEDLRVVRTTIRQNEEAIHRLTYEKQPFKVADLIERAKAKLEEASAAEASLLRQIEQIECGLFDEKLSEEMKANAKQAKEKAEKKATKKIAALKISERKTNKEMKVERRKNFLENKTFVSEKEQAIEYSRYLNSVKKLPDKLWERLQKMPNNHGILYYGIWFMGALPDKKPYDTTVIQEKDGDLFLVHYYTPTMHYVYKKEGYGRNTKEILLRQTPRRRITFNHQ